MNHNDAQSLGHYLHRTGANVGFGAALLFSTIALALAGFAISFTLHFVSEQGWRWTIIIILAIAAIIVILWWLWALLKWGSAGRGSSTGVEMHASARRM